MLTRRSILSGFAAAAVVLPADIPGDEPASRLVQLWEARNAALSAWLAVRDEDSAEYAEKAAVWEAIEEEIVNYPSQNAADIAVKLRFLADIWSMQNGITAEEARGQDLRLFQAAWLDAERLAGFPDPFSVPT